MRFENHRNEFLIEGDADTIVKRLFQKNSKGGLNFGPSGYSKDACSINNLFEQSVEFMDYVMEGFVKYKLSVRPYEQGLKVYFELLGTNRDEHICYLLKYNISHAGYVLE